jgi:protein gp37
MAIRLKAMGHPNYTNGFRVSLHNHVLKAPLAWKRPSIIFVNSMSDLFHEYVPLDFIRKVFNIIKRSPHHRYQILTKRAERLADIDSSLIWPDNVWIGVSVESESFIYRIDYLRKTHANVKFLSFEPLLGPISHLELAEIDWVIAGGESGPRARPMRPEWVIEIRDKCIEANVPFFFKQWGGKNKKKAGRKLEGRTWNQMPSIMPILWPA